MEHNTRKTLPERSQRDYRDFNTKNKNYLPPDSGWELCCSDGRGDPLHPLQALLEGAVGQQQLSSSDFTLRKK
jgi:hypothetical protein